MLLNLNTGSISVVVVSLVLHLHMPLIECIILTRIAFQFSININYFNTNI